MKIFLPFGRAANPFMTSSNLFALTWAEINNRNNGEGKIIKVHAEKRMVSVLSAMETAKKERYNWTGNHP